MVDAGRYSVLSREMSDTQAPGFSSRVQECSLRGVAFVSDLADLYIRNRPLGAPEGMDRI